jgi:hypothetical protein
MITYAIALSIQTDIPLLLALVKKRVPSFALTLHAQRLELW